MAGGTGGHIMPGLAVADVLRQRGWRVLWLGNPDKMEGRLVPPRGIELVPLRFAGVRGKGAAALLKLPFLLLRAFAQAWGRLSAVKPDVVLGMGGYVAFPGGVIAALRARRWSCTSRTPWPARPTNGWPGCRAACSAVSLACCPGRSAGQSGARRPVRCPIRRNAMARAPAHACWSWAAAWARRR